MRQIIPSQHHSVVLDSLTKQPIDFFMRDGEVSIQLNVPSILLGIQLVYCLGYYLGTLQDTIYVISCSDSVPASEEECCTTRLFRGHLGLSSHKAHPGPSATVQSRPTGQS